MLLHWVLSVGLVWLTATASSNNTMSTSMRNGGRVSWADRRPPRRTGGRVLQAYTHVDYVIVANLAGQV